MKYYIRLAGKVEGPFSEDELRTMASVGQGGRFSPIHEVSTDGKRTWTPAANHPNLLRQALPGKKRRQPDPPPPAPAPAPAVEEQPVALEVAGLAPQAPVELTEFEDAPAWYYHQNGAHMGPLALPELQRKIRAGELPGEVLVWQEDTPNWVKIKDHPLLAAGLPRAGSAQTSSQAGATAAGETSPLAIAALVAAITGLTFFPILGSLLAVVFGHMALGQLKRDSRLQGRNLALAGLVMGYVELAIYLLAGFVLVIVLLAFRS